MSKTMCGLGPSVANGQGLTPGPMSLNVPHARQATHIFGDKLSLASLSYLALESVYK